MSNFVSLQNVLFRLKCHPSQGVLEQRQETDDASLTEKKAPLYDI